MMASASENDEMNIALTQYHEQLADSTGFKYDPNQSAEEARGVKTAYQTLLQKIQERKHDLARPDSDELSQLVEESNELLERVKQTNMSTLDSKFLVLSADIGAEKMSHLQKNAMYTLDNFCNRLSVPLDLKKMGAHSLLLGKTVLAPDFLYGPISIAPKKPIIRKQRSKEEIAPVQVAETIKSESLDQTANETTAIVISIFKKLIECTEDSPINFFIFIVNPDSFANTVENLFYVSFLIRDNRAKIEVIDGELYLSVFEGDPSEEEEGKRHLIMDLDMQLWREAIAKYKIKHSIIPTRTTQ